MPRGCSARGRFAGFRPDNLNPNSAAARTGASMDIASTCSTTSYWPTDRHRKQCRSILVWNCIAEGHSAQCAAFVSVDRRFLLVWAGNRRAFARDQHAGTAVLKPGDMLAELRRWTSFVSTSCGCGGSDLAVALGSLFWGRAFTRRKGAYSDAFNNFCS